MKIFWIIPVFFTSCSLHFVSNKTNSSATTRLVFYKDGGVVANKKDITRLEKAGVIDRPVVQENDTVLVYQFQLMKGKRVNIQNFVVSRSSVVNRRFQLCLNNWCELIPYPIKSEKAVLARRKVLWKIYEFRASE